MTKKYDPNTTATPEKIIFECKTHWQDIDFKIIVYWTNISRNNDGKILHQKHAVPGNH